MAGLEDQELAAIRAARLNQLQQEGSLSPSLPTGEGSGGNGPGQGESQKAEEEMRRDVLATVLDSSARERRTS
jgi:DNA-binding TFAR19-related protein (PDSD5 family)